MAPMLESYDLRQALVYLWTDSTKFPAKYQSTTFFKVVDLVLNEQAILLYLGQTITPTVWTYSNGR